MVGIFAGLKWRLVSSRIRGMHGAAKAWMIVGWCAAAIFLGLVALGLATLRGQPALARTTIVTLFTLQLVGWVLTPIVAFGVDETVDPARFALLPIRPAQLRRGLLVASLIGYLPVANAVVLIGAAVALSSSWSLLPVALVCSAAQLVLCIVLSRAASTSMAGLMSGRRGRDLGMAVGSVLFVGYLLLSYAVNSSGRTQGLDAKVDSAAGVLAWGPSGSLAAIASFIAAGQWVRLLLALLTAGVVLAAGWWWWSVALDKSLTSVPSTTQGSAPVGRAGSERAVADSLRGMVALTVARDRVLGWRDPMRRLPWLLVATLAAIWPLLVVRGHGSLYAVAFPAVIIGSQSGNSYAVEGTGLWLHMVTFADRTRARGELLGHSLFSILVGGPIVVLATLLQAVIRGDMALVPAALGVSLAVMVGSVAMSCHLSARIPFAMRQSRKSLFANSIPGQKGRTLAWLLLTVAGAVACALPAIGLAVLAATVDRSWGWAALLVGPAVSAGALILLSRSGANAYLERTPEILATVAIGDRI